MSIERFFNKAAIIRRLTEVIGDPDRSTFQQVATISCHIQQLSAEESALVGGVYGKTWRMYCSRGVDITESDKVEIDGTAYNIKGIKDLEVEQSTINHLEVVLIEDLS